MRASRVVIFVCFLFVFQVSFFRATQPQSDRYRLGTMDTRSRTRIRATSSPPREVTEGGTQPVTDAFVDQPSSAIGLSGDGKVSSRSTSLEAGPRRTCHLTASSESVSGMHGPAQAAMYEENRGFVGTVCSDIVCISTPDVRPISTYMRQKRIVMHNQGGRTWKSTYLVLRRIRTVQLSNAIIK